MRLGRIKIELGYVIDLDNTTMVDEAKDCIMEDLTELVIRGGSEEVEASFKIVEDASLKEEDIPAFLKESAEEDAEPEAGATV